MHRPNRPLRALSLAALALGASVLAAQGCSAEPAPPAAVIPAPGQLMVALTTDLVPGKDFDELRLIVSYEGRVDNRTSLTWTVSEGSVRGSVGLPATIAIVGRAGADGPVTVRAVAYRDGVPRVLREAHVDMPPLGARLLRLEVSGLCYEHVVRSRREEPRSDCDPGAACVLGTCASTHVDWRALPEYAPAAVFGTASPGAKDAACLDVLGAFAGGFDAEPTIEGDRCVLRAADLVRPALPVDAGASSGFGEDGGARVDGGFGAAGGASDASTSPPPARTDASAEEPIAFEGNIAVRYAPNSPGFCTADHCLVPLVADAALGWSSSGARIVLPRAICDNPSPRVIVAPRGPRMGPALHPCGEWHASSGAPRSKELVVPLQTNGRPCRDVRALCIEHQTTCGGLWVKDSSCGVVRRIECGACRGNTNGMVLVPGGTFLFGAPDSDPDGGGDEKPQSPLAMASFWIDRTEVTTADYAACIAAGICTRGNTGGFCNMQANDRPLPGRERHPINCVDWYHASAFCAWRGARLPTEQEWEFVARGGAGGTRTFPWGEELPRPDRACMSDRESGDRGSTCEVGAHPLGRSAHGLEDLSGNVWEWTSSVYDERGHGYVENPEERTEKGGCWTNFWTPDKPSQRAHLRAAFRSYDARGYQSRTVGFRCARDL